MNKPRSDDVSGIHETLTATYQRESTDDRVAVVDGYGLSVTVNHGRLVVHDGIGKHRRTREFSRVERTLKRLIIIGNDGYITLGALEWCRNVGVMVINVGRDGNTFATTNPSTDDARLRRAQAYAGEDGPHSEIGLEITKGLLARKLSGQAWNVRELLGQQSVSDAIGECAASIAKAATINECRSYEGQAAALYWDAWTGRVCLPWSTADYDRVPPHWWQYISRSTMTSPKARNATDPINAILNFCYRMAEIECRLACLATGLDPGFGFLHLDQEGRDSLTLDLMEVIRPHVERYVLGLLGYGETAHKFTRRNFKESNDGTCRILPPLTHELGETGPMWIRIIAPIAEEIALALSASANGYVRIGKPTRDKTMMQARPRRASKSSLRKVAKPGNVTVEQLIPDDVWEQMTRFMPVPDNRKGGRPPANPRAVLAAIAYVEMANLPWTDVPRSFGVSDNTCRRRYREWKANGVLDRYRKIVRSTA